MVSWNEFRKQHSGQGLSAAEISDRWKRYKEGDYQLEQEEPDAREGEEPDAREGEEPDAREGEEPDESDEDEDLTAAVEAATDEPDDTAETVAVTPSSDAAGLGDWARAWLATENSQLSGLLPAMQWLRQPSVNVALLLAGTLTFLLLLYNIFIGLATGCQADLTAGCSVDWWTLLSNKLLQESVVDSSPAPGEPDWVGSLLIFLSASLIWSTMPAPED